MTEMTTAAPATRTAQPTIRNRHLVRLSAVVANMRPVFKVGLTLPVALALVVAALASSASPAAAYTQSSSLYAGYVGVPSADGVKMAPGSGYVGGVQKVLQMGVHVIGESVAYGNRGQWACQETRLWAIQSTSWILANSDYRCYWMAASQTGVAFPTFYFGSLATNVGYSVDVTTTWHLGDHSQIATSYVDYRHLGDYKCYASNCFKTSSNWAGAYLWFGV